MALKNNKNVQYKAYYYRSYPTKPQAVLIDKTIGCSRFIYNKMLSDRTYHYQQIGSDIALTPADYKEQFPWLREVDSLALCNAQLNLNKAYKNFYDKKVASPNSKRRALKTVTPPIT